MRLRCYSRHPLRIQKLICHDLAGLVLCLAALPCLTLAAPVNSGLVCKIPTAGIPCGAGSANSLGVAGPGLDTGLGNPVNLYSGVKHQQDIDLPEPFHGGHAGFVRHYRSDRPAAGILGPGWSSAYDMHLHRHATGWHLRLPDGSRLEFDASGKGREERHGWLEGAGQNLTWHGPDGRRLGFDTAGMLYSMHVPGRPAIYIERHQQDALQGRINTIRRGTSTLKLHYSHGLHGWRLQTLDTPLGSFAYAYDQLGRLQSVRRPDGMQRVYHYADSTSLLSGVSLVTADGRSQRVRSWQYDKRGRVVRAVPGPPDQERGRLDFTWPASTAGGVARTLVHSQAGMGEFTYRQRGGRLVPDTMQLQSPAEPVAHDAQGRLVQVSGLRIVRDAAGSIVRLQQDSGGWPGLRLDYDAHGRSSWASRLTGPVQVQRGPDGRLLGLQHANGDRLDISTDSIGRPQLLHYRRKGHKDVQLGLRWHGSRLVQIQHPHETEHLSHDNQGRLIMRTVERPLPAGLLRYHERFAHDDAGRLRRHELPEGGVLLYDWHADGRLEAIHWQNATGRKQTVLETVAGMAGYRHGNGLHTQTLAGHDGNTHSLVLSGGQEIIWAERREHDAHGRVQAMWRAAPALDYAMQAHYAHDKQGRLQGETSDGSRETSHWYAWNDDGSLLAQRSSGTSRPDLIVRDAAGLPLALGDLQLQFGAQRRLATVSRGGQMLARYTHNGRGQRIRQEYAHGQTERYYLDNRLVGVWHRKIEPEKTFFGISQRYIYAHDVPVGLLQARADGSMQLYFIHSDLQGRPVLITDQARRTRWAAHHDTLGQAHILSGDLDLPLRWPGQDADPVTGWHDNVFRTYMPANGHYLEPDPLGPLPGQQALGYAGQQPLRLTDPLGLILLAFDGTRQGRDNRSNVWKLSQAYADGPSYYHHGPGSNLYLNWDAVTAASSGQILRNQWESLMNALERARNQGSPAPIDIIGYSRGAALARDFANRIARQTSNGWFSYDDPVRGTIGLCVDLRFLGLFDTVAQFGLLGAANAGYDLNISDAWGWVAHAVASHELRVLYPLVSATAEGVGNVAEAPFIGAHADIGGGIALDDTGNSIRAGDLSDVTLNWMYWQAMAAQVQLHELAPDDRSVTQPWLHDERLAVQRLTGGDRGIQDSNTSFIGPQGRDPVLGDAQRQVFEAWIRRVEDWKSSSDRRVGVVDMDGYSAWLESALGMPALTNPARQP